MVDPQSYFYYVVHQDRLTGWMARLVQAIICRFVWSAAALQVVRSKENDRKNVKRVAIIGGGIGGTSCSYFLSQMSPKSYSIDLFEPNTIGGRMATIKMGGEQFESGATIIHPENKYMVELTRDLGLQKQDEFDEGDSIGIYNGKEFAFLESSWALMTLGRLLWRYGLDTIRLKWHINDMLAKFSNIYRLQSAGVGFESVPKMLQSMSPDFAENKQSLREYLTEKGFSTIFIDEFVTAVNLVNYGQTTSIPSFVGSVSLAGATPKLWSVFGGNKQVPEKLLQKSEAKLIRNRVDLIRRETNGKFSLESTDENGNLEIFSGYDAVVVAFPLISGQESKLKTQNLPSLSGSYGGYHQTVATFVRGNIRASTWNKTEAEMPGGVLACNEHLFYCSVGQWLPVDWKKGQSVPKGEERAWKIFSPQPLTNGQIDELFEKVLEKSESVWFAYPQYDKAPKIMDFELGDNLYYVNAVEWAASAMEMSAIGGKNVALLINRKFTDDKSAAENAGKTEL